MIKSIYVSAKSRLMSSLPSQFLKNDDGIAAIEFAFIAPVMLFMYFGMAEVATAITVDRQVSHSANVAGDLTTQSETVSADEMSEIMTATMLVMGIPASEQGNVTIEIASYSRDADDNVVPMGTAVLNGPFPVAFDASTLDSRILSNTSGVVVARVNYNYEPLKLRYMPSNFDLREVFMLKPRKSANVEIKDTDGSSSYTCSFSAGKPSCTTGGTTT
ncbi:MAG: TadE/TadG family type IV pilus assembly protein [Hellea sp.]